MYFTGILIGLFSFGVIGLFHPIVIKCEYYFSSSVWPVFAVAGTAILLCAVFMESIFLSALLSVLGFTCLWSILEIKEQEERVRKGWFPENPRRKEKAAGKKLSVSNRDK